MKFDSNSNITNGPNHYLKKNKIRRSLLTKKRPQMLKKIITKLLMPRTIFDLLMHFKKKTGVVVHPTVAQGMVNKKKSPHSHCGSLAVVPARPL